MGAREGLVKKVAVSEHLRGRRILRVRWGREEVQAEVGRCWDGTVLTGFQEERGSR